MESEGGAGGGSESGGVGRGVNEQVVVVVVGDDGLQCRLLEGGDEEVEGDNDGEDDVDGNVWE